MGAARERPKFDNKLNDFSLRSSPEVFSTRDTSARQRRFEIRDFPLIGELLKNIEPHLLVCQLNYWQLCTTMWSSPISKSLHPDLVTTLRVDFPGESLRTTTGGFASNCPVPEAWATESSGLLLLNVESINKKYVISIQTSHRHHTYKECGQGRTSTRPQHS